MGNKKKDNSLNLQEPDEKSLNKDEPIGVTGTAFNGTTFTEELLTDLQYPEGYVSYDRMRRSDYQVKRLLRAVETPIMSSSFNYLPIDKDDKEQIKQAAFKNKVLHEFMVNPWSQTLKEILSFLPFGFSVFEPWFHTIDTKDFGKVQTIRNLGFRKQSTIKEWNLNEDGTINWVNQQVYDGDFPVDTTIPGDELLIFSNEREGDNYEGVSILRSAYGSYVRKDLYLKLSMIGIEKMAIGTPTFYLSERLSSDPEERAKIEAIGRTYTSHQSAFMILPEELKDNGFVIQRGEYNGSAVSEAINREDKSILDGVLASFLEIGVSRSGGNAQNEGLMGMFLNSLCHIGDYIAQTLDPLVHSVYVLNFGEPKVQLSMNCDGINRKNFKEISDILSVYSKSGIIQPDDKLEAFVRNQMKLPDIDEGSIRITKKDPNNIQDRSDDVKKDLSDTHTHSISNKQLSLPHIEMQEEFSRDLTKHEKGINITGIHKTFTSSDDRYKAIVRENLNKANAKYISDLKVALKQSNPDRAVASIKIGFNRQLREELKLFLRDLVKKGTNQARGELGLTELSIINFADDGVIKNVPIRIDHISKKNADDIMSQFEDKAILGSLNLLEDDNLSDKEIVTQSEENTDSFIESAAPYLGVGVLVNKYINMGRNNTFFRNRDLVQGWQYSAVLDSRTTDLCLSLDGKTAPQDDPVWNSFAPPLHWSCRSILVPILLNAPPEEFTGVSIEPINRNGKVISEDEIRKQKQF